MEAGGAGEAEVALDVSEVATSSEAVVGFSKLLLTSVPSLAGHLLRLGRSMP